jgi:hypothetical protein
MHDTLNLAPLFPDINEFVGLVMTGIAGWAVKWLLSVMKGHAAFLDQQTQELIASGFSRALQNGMSIATAKLQAGEAEHSTVTVNSWLAQVAGQYAIDHSPDYVATFLGDKTPQEAIQHAADKALAYLPK